KWFYSNVCHVCKKENNNDLISCAECDMISYCSDEHKQLHNEKHREICGYLKEYIKSHMGNETGVDHVTWINSRLQFLNSIKKRLSRKLEPYEEQMILFAKSCFSCHQQIHLENCRRCYSINYCVVHAQEFKIQHESRCNELLFGMNLDILYLNTCPLKNRFLNFWQSNPIEDMETFINQYVRANATLTKEIKSWEVKCYLYSDYVSGPLTLFYAMRDANLLHFLNISPPKCIIHIVVSTYHDIEYLAAWELLSHLLCPAIKILKIVLIGQELTQKVGSILLCCNCINKELKVKYEFCPKLYCDYMKCQTYEQPSVVVGF
ncbi:hypothetical protein EAI_07996, partial [Harpegnathos saltator]